MKTCPRCGSGTNPFAKDRNSKDGLQFYCGPCSAKMNKDYYERNKAEHNAVSARSKRERQREAQLYVIEQKKAPCMDCGQHFNPWQMDFDHRDGSKKKDIVTRLACTGYTLEVVKAEVAKCDLVCANCHRNRTFKRGQQRHGRATLYSV